jgi:hypothetical protein
MPPGTDMTDAELRDHAEEILTAVIKDMSVAQTFGKDNRCVNSSVMARSCCIRHRRAVSPAELVWPDTRVTHHSATGNHNHRGIV